MSERVTLSLLDRLQEDRAAPTIERLKISLWRDLSGLLNTKRHDPGVPEEYDSLSDSLLNFGLPDFTALTLASPSEQTKLTRALEVAIRRFEPRLSSVSVHLQPPGEHSLDLRFRIEAMLKIEPWPEPITFDTVLEPDSHQFRVGSS